MYVDRVACTVPTIATAALLDDPVEAAHFLLNSMLPGVWCPDQLAATTTPVPNMLAVLGLDSLALGFGTMDNGVLGVARTVSGPSATSSSLALHPVEGQGTACKAQVFWYLSTTGMRCAHGGLLCCVIIVCSQADAADAGAACSHAAPGAAVGDGGGSDQAHAAHACHLCSDGAVTPCPTLTTTSPTHS